MLGIEEVCHWFWVLLVDVAKSRDFRTPILDRKMERMYTGNYTHSTLGPTTTYFAAVDAHPLRASQLRITQTVRPRQKKRAVFLTYSKALEDLKYKHSPYLQPAGATDRDNCDSFWMLEHGELVDCRASMAAWCHPCIGEVPLRRSIAWLPLRRSIAWYKVKWLGGRYFH